jgi:hypothetical protein
MATNTEKIKSSIFGDINPCSPLKINQYLVGICRLHLQDGRIEHARNQIEAGRKLSSEDGSKIFLRNISSLSKGCPAVYPRRYNSPSPPL